MNRKSCSQPRKQRHAVLNTAQISMLNKNNAKGAAVPQRIHSAKGHTISTQFPQRYQSLLAVVWWIRVNPPFLLGEPPECCLHPHALSELSPSITGFGFTKGFLLKWPVSWQFIAFGQFYTFMTFCLLQSVKKSPASWDFIREVPPRRWRWRDINSSKCFHPWHQPSMSPAKHWRRRSFGDEAVGGFPKLVVLIASWFIDVDESWKIDESS